MTTLTRVLLVLTLLEFLLVATPHTPAGADEAQFSLAVGQSVTVGQYTLVFRGISGRLPAYELYSGSVLLARYPSTASPPNPAEYAYGNGRVGIATTGLAPDGSTVTGIMIVR